MKEKTVRFFKNLYNFMLANIRTVAAVGLAFLIIVLLWTLYRYFFGYHITIKFKELEPIHRNMTVYYKGFKVGRTGAIKPSPDFTTMKVRVYLDQDINRLPDNIKAVVRKIEAEDRRGKTSYVDLEYPKIPSARFVVKGSTIEGEAAKDLQSFISKQVESGSLTIMSDNMEKTIESVQATSDQINVLVSDIRVILGENRQNILATTTSVSSITKNINDITQSVNIATKNLDRLRLKVDSVLNNVNSATSNMNQITTGIKDTMSKRFGTARMIFGAPVPKSDLKLNK